MQFLSDNVIILIEVSGRFCQICWKWSSLEDLREGCLAVSAEMPIERVSGAGSANEDAAASDVAHAE